MGYFSSSSHHIVRVLGVGGCLVPSFSEVCLIFEERMGGKASFWKNPVELE